MNGLATGPGHPLQRIGVQRLKSLASSMVDRYVVDMPNARQDEDVPLLTGQMHLTELQPGMHLRLVDVRDRCDLASHAELPAGIKVAMVIGGEARVRYGREILTLGPSSASSGLLATLRQATPFSRFGRTSGCERTLILTLTPAWLARHGHDWPIGDVSPHPRLTRWHPSPGLLTLAHQCFAAQPLAGTGDAYRLQLTGFALAMAGEALAAEEIPQDRKPALKGADMRLERLMTMIDDGEARHASQVELARRLGMSLSSLQRRFRKQYDQSLGQFLRRWHLESAHYALIGQGVSIDTAADLAGYASAPNFTTAFKREFGITPSECRMIAQSGTQAAMGHPPL